jgi:Ni/Fe-hydrogenase 1 B-type cytochrome subunit
MTDQVRRVRVWPGVLRITHWTMALTVIVLLLSGWLLKSGLVLSDRLYDFLLEQLHLPAGHLLGVALAVRLFYLLRDTDIGGFSALLPSRSSWPGILTGLRFYTSFARSEPPRYYGHHPVWAPLYLVWMALLWSQLVSGLLLEFGALRGLFGLASDPLLRWHLAPFTLLSMLAILHVVSAFLHDLKGQGSDVSGMINGHRTFVVERSEPAAKVSQAVSLDSIGGWTPKQRDSDGE